MQKTASCGRFICVTTVCGEGVKKQNKKQTQFEF
ncbi:hypothetical protein VPHK327_0022 [Vibrio phage K327]